MVWNAFFCRAHYVIGLSPAQLFLLMFDLAGALLMYTALSSWFRTATTIELSPSSLSSRQRPLPMQRGVAVDARSIRDLELVQHTIDDYGTTLTHRLVAVTDARRITTQLSTYCTRCVSTSASTHRLPFQRTTSGPCLDATSRQPLPAGATAKLFATLVDASSIRRQHRASRAVCEGRRSARP